VVKSISAMKDTGRTDSGPSLSNQAAASNSRNGNDEKGTVDSRRGVEDEQQSTGLLTWLSTMCIVS